MFIRKSIKCKKTCTSFALILLILALSYGTFGGCGVDYDTPANLTDTPTSLITAADLQGWMAAGLVNSSGYNNVVILDVNPGSKIAACNSNHLTGAYCVSTTEVTATRSEGVGVSTSFMIPDGAAMDALIQRTGIGPNTTIVLVSSQDKLQRPTMAYAAFRYWGFPKNKLKILDGTTTDWTGASLSMDGVVQPILNSSYSVRRNPSLRPEFRTSFPEMIDVVDGKVANSVILDTRNPASTFCQTPLCGTISGTVSFFYETKIVTDSTLKNFLGNSTLSTNFTNDGVTSTTNTVVYCNSGYFATLAFFALDGILGWPVSYYDGSWFQWAQMSDNTNATNGKGIDPNSPWITDPNLSTRSAGTTIYNTGTVSRYPDPAISFDATVNEIEQEDVKYMGTGSGGGSGSGGAGGC